MRQVPLLAIAMGLFAISAGAQSSSRPDFTGQWALDPGPAPQAGARGGAGRSGDMGTGWGSALTMAQDVTSLTVQYSFFTRGDMQPPLKFVFALDGSESVNTVMMGRGMQQERSRVVWEGQVLVITTSHTFVDPVSGKPSPMSVIRRLSLDNGALVIETTRKGVMGAADTSTKATYRRTTGGTYGSGAS